MADGDAAGGVPAAILVTGGTGFIGRRLLERLIEERQDGGGLFATARPGALGALPAGVTAVPWDLRQEIPTAAMPPRVDAVVHLAVPRDRYEPGPDALPKLIRVGVDATAQLYAWARGAGARHVVHASTVSVLRPRIDVGELLNDWGPRVEAPAHPYALTKAWAEDIAVGLRGSIEAVTLVRPASVYGPGQGELGTVARIAQRVVAGEPIEIVEPDGHRFTPVFLDDVVEVLLGSLGHPADVTFSVGGPEALSEREVAEELGRWLGRSPAFVAGTGISQMFGVSSAWVDALFPERPRTPFREGMRRTWPREEAPRRRDVTEQ